MSINIQRDYLSVTEAMKAVGWGRTKFYELLNTPLFKERGAIAKRGRTTYIAKSVLDKYNEQQEIELYGKP